MKLQLQIIWDLLLHLLK